MGKKKKGVVIHSGTIETEVIYNTHTKIKAIVESYKETNLKVSRVTATVKENWVGKGCNEFTSQYNILIKKIEDFGDTLQEIYDALVDAEQAYEDADDSIRQEFAMAKKG